VFMQTAVSLGQQISGQAPAVLPKGGPDPSLGLVKRNKMLVVKRQA
jgi:hypothetical protein